MEGGVVGAAKRRPGGRRRPYAVRDLFSLLSHGLAPDGGRVDFAAALSALRRDLRPVGKHGRRAPRPAHVATHRDMEPGNRPPAFPSRPPRSGVAQVAGHCGRSEAHTSELQSLMRISYAVFCLKKKKQKLKHHTSSVHINATTT